MARKLPRNILDRWDYWKKQIEQWQQSGLSQAEFCRQNGLVKQQLSKWKVKLRDEQIVKSPTPGKTKKSPCPSPRPDRFVEVKLPDSIQSSYQIKVANGRILQVPHAYDPQIISELIAIMEQTC